MEDGFETKSLKIELRFISISSALATSEELSVHMLISFSNEK